MAGQIYEGQNPILLILSVGILSAVAEELVFRGMIYRRAKDFWGFGWGMAVSCLLFGIYHGNVVQFVYASLVSVLLILIYEKTGTLLGPILAHIAENIWGLYRRGFLNLLSEKSGGAAWAFVFFEAVLCAVSFWYLFLRKEKGKGKQDGK
ncbi:MAG: CPBP family intramembrane metalloprotease [Fusicatenibacter sp.]|nr:CPBP family intramembrane metalloprotease [Fusicatenibacter sp.]